jgi:hypothetical protein
MMIPMGGVRRFIRVNGRDRWTLFDSGSRNTYVIGDVARDLVRTRLPHPRRVGLGGSVREFHEICTLFASIDGKTVEGDAYVVDGIGVDENGRPIEILFGALLMQKWGIRLCPDSESVDLAHYPEEFIEYAERTDPRPARGLIL